MFNTGTATSALATSVGRESSRAMTEAEFEAFYRKHGRALMSYLTRLCGDATLAEDLFQKSFFLFLRASVPISDEAEVKAYLYRVATNVMNDHWRRTKREGEQHSLEVVSERAAPAVVQTDTDFSKVLGQLNPKDRALLWFAHVEELEHREIAKRLGVQEKSVKVLLFRARRRIGALLQEYGLVPGGSR